MLLQKGKDTAQRQSDGCECCPTQITAVAKLQSTACQILVLNDNRPN